MATDIMLSFYHVLWERFTIQPPEESKDVYSVPQVSYRLPSSRCEVTRILREKTNSFLALVLGLVGLLEKRRQFPVQLIHIVLIKRCMRLFHG